MDAYIELLIQYVTFDLGAVSKGPNPIRNIILAPGNGTNSTTGLPEPEQVYEENIIYITNDCITNGE